MVYLNVPHLLLVSGLVDLLLQQVHLLERLQAVHAVDQHETVCHRVVVLWKVLPIVDPFGVIQPQLFLYTSIRFN